MGLSESFRNWRRNRAVINELDRMSNRELDDMGIARSSIRQIVRQSR